VPSHWFPLILFFIFVVSVAFATDVYMSPTGFTGQPPSVYVDTACCLLYLSIRYDTIEEFNVDSKAEYSALSSTHSQKKKLKQTNANAALIQ